MKEEYLEVGKILKELLNQDKSLLINYEELLGKLRERGVKRSGCQAIENAMKYKCGEVMNQVDSSHSDSISEGCLQLEDMLQNNHMQKARIEFIVDVFSYALGWQEQANCQTAEKEAEQIVETETSEDVLTNESKGEAEGWQCSFCGEENYLFYCENCGRKKPDKDEQGDWICIKCGKTNRNRFCTACGTARPVQQPEVWICTVCGKENYGKFCTGCGQKRLM